MGAMQKVMQKLHGEPHGEGNGKAAAPGAVAAPHDAVPNTPASDATTFVADRPAAPQPINSELLEQTREWNPQRTHKALVVFHERYSAVSEHYRSLRARLLNMNPKQLHQILAITSSLPQEGKSVTAINLGMALAEGNERQVVIVDADFRRASIARLLGTNSRPGLADLIRGKVTQADILQPTPFPGLKIIPAGATDDRQYEQLVGTNAAQIVLNELRENFDYVLIDTPPVNTVSDVCMLAPHCDGAVLVIEMRRTPEPTVQEAVRSLQTTGVKILGCILSRYSNPRGYYYDRYYSHYYSSD